MYRNKYNEDAESDTYIPDYPDLSGDCSESDISSVSIGFKEFVLSIIFKKTPGGERWYVHRMDLTYSTSNPSFLHIDRPGLNVSIYIILYILYNQTAHTNEDMLYTILTKTLFIIY